MYIGNRLDGDVAVDVFMLNMTFVMSSCSLCPYSVLLVKPFQLFIMQDFWNRYANNASKNILKSLILMLIMHNDQNNAE